MMNFVKSKVLSNIGLPSEKRRLYKNPSLRRSKWHVLKGLHVYPRMEWAILKLN